MTDTTAAAPALEFRPVTLDRWPDLAALFDGRGGPKYCWCMVWRPWPAGLERSRPNKRAEMERTVLGGTTVGILAYVEGEPVAWCSVAPRETYRKLGGDEYPPGANVVEGYPVDPDSPSFQYMGRRKTFLAAGFEEIGRVGTRRHVMRRWLRS